MNVAINNEREDQLFFESAMQKQMQADTEAELEKEDYLWQVLNDEAESEALMEEENEAYLWQQIEEENEREHREMIEIWVSIELKREKETKGKQLLLEFK